MATLSLAWRMLLRDWRAGELRVLALALVLAVASVASVGFFADRVRQALAREAQQLIGADLVVQGDRPVRGELRDELRRRGLRQAQSTGFVSMVRKGENAQLAGVKGVSEGYPLRGRLRTAPQVNAPDAAATGIPAPGTVWVDERLAATLAARVGDGIELGNSSFKIGAILTLEPDRGASFFNIAPRLMLRDDEIAATGLVQAGSRIWYTLLASGEREPVAQFEAWVKPKLARGENLQSLENARPEIRASIDRSQQLIGLTALLAVILAAVAVGLSTRRYSQRHLDGYAVMRCFGASQSRLFALFAWEFLLLGVAAAIAGGLAGYAAQYVIAAMVSGLMLVELPQPTLLPAMQGMLVGLCLLLGFSLPPLLQLKNVPALRVIRRDVGAPRQGALAGYAAGTLTIAGLLIWQAGDAKLGLIVLGGFAAAGVVFAASGYAALHGLGRFSGGGGLSWRYGLASLRRRAGANTVQIIALSLGLAAILMLTFTRGDLLETWRSKVPPDAPNRFIVNIQPEQRSGVLAFFRNAKLAEPVVYPMIRGRYIAKNGQAVSENDFEERARRLVEREFNLSYMAAKPAHNSVVAGRWFSEDDQRKGALSVEEGIARTLGWKLGDVLSWQVAGRTFSAPITSVRKLDWDSMRVNFFVIATPGLLGDFPASFVTSFNLPVADAGFTSKLSQAFTNLTLVDMSAIMAQAQALIEQVVRAVQFVFLFALGAGVLVLYAALLATQDERMQEAAVMRALGASRAQVVAAQRVEFAALGIISGLLASAAAVAIGWAVAHFVFQFAYRMNGWIWLAGPILGLACVGYNAWSGARAALSRPPILALREA